MEELAGHNRNDRISSSHLSVKISHLDFSSVHIVTVKAFLRHTITLDQENYLPFITYLIITHYLIFIYNTYSYWNWFFETFQLFKRIITCLSLLILVYFLILSKFGKITLCAYLDLCVYLFFEKCRPCALIWTWAIIRNTRVGENIYNLLYLKFEWLNLEEQ